MLIRFLKGLRKEFKSISEFNYNFYLFIKYHFYLFKRRKSIFLKIWRQLYIFWKELFFINNLHKLIKFILTSDLLTILEYLLNNNSKAFSRLEPFLKRTVLYVLCFIMFGMFGLLLGFSVGLYKGEHQRNKEIDVFTLVLLLEILYGNKFGSALSEYLQDLYPSFFELNKAEDCLKITPQTVEYINPSPLQIMLEQQEKIPQIPFPILGDPYLSIEIDWEWDDSRNSKYKFELFTFYKNINEKLQS